MELLHQRDFRYSLIDGMFANAYINLTTGVFLTGFLLFLKMDDLLIGIVLAIPQLVALFQLPACLYFCKNGGIKNFTRLTTTISRLMWLAILGIAIWSPLNLSFRCILVMIFFFISQAFGSASFVGWLFWTSTLVPEEKRGLFFGTRNALCGGVGILTVIVFGNLVDFFRAREELSLIAATMPFWVAIPLGVIGVHFSKYITEPEEIRGARSVSVREIVLPFKDHNFRVYLIFIFLWNFSVYFASPFFSLFFLREMKFSYGFIAVLSTTCALADMLVMRSWGRLADRINNKAVIQLGGWGAFLLPFLWTLVRPEDIFIPILLQVISGGFWAGINLCTQNLLLSISPQKDRGWFISAYGIVAGLGAAGAPILAGILLRTIDTMDLARFGGKTIPLYYIFLLSSGMRFMSLLVLGFVHEPRKIKLRRIIHWLENRLKMSIALRSPIPILPHNPRKVCK